MVESQMIVEWFINQIASQEQTKMLAIQTVQLILWFVSHPNIRQKSSIQMAVLTG